MTPLLLFRSSSLLSEFAAIDSPPTSPQSHLFADTSVSYLDFPFSLPVPSTSSTSPSSPSSSPLSVSTDSSHYTALTSAPWHDSLVPLSLSRPSHPHSPPSNQSFHTSRLSSSAPSNSQPSQLTNKRRKRRGADAAVDADERLQRRRTQHRAVDANRRQRENEAIARLTQLIGQQQQVKQEVDEETEDGEEDKGESNNSKKAGRLTVLESSIALIEQLTSACKRMDAACNAKDAQVSRVSNQLHSVAAVIAQQASSLSFVDPMMDGIGAAGLGGACRTTDLSHFPPTSSFLSVLATSTSSYLLHLESSRTLRQSTTSLLSSMCMLIIALPSKVVIDVNEHFLSMTGHRRSDVLYHSIEDSSLCAGANQFPASLAAVDAVVAGEKRRGSAMWRCRRAGGLLYEVLTSFYGLYDDSAAEVGVEEKRMADRMLILSSPDELVLVGETRAADVS